MNTSTSSSTTTIRFTCAESGAGTFADLVGATIHEITLNGNSVDPATAYADSRIALSDLAAENVLVQSRSLTVNDPAFRATVTRVVVDRGGDTILAQGAAFAALTLVDRFAEGRVRPRRPRVAVRRAASIRTAIGRPGSRGPRPPGGRAPPLLVHPPPP